MTGLTEVWEKNHGDYFKIALHVIERARASAQNKKTKIVVAGVVLPEGTHTAPRAAERSREAGADVYADYFSNNAIAFSGRTREIDEFLEEVISSPPHYYEKAVNTQ